MRVALAVLCQFAMLGAVSAAELASGDQIRAAITGNTVQGNMSSSGAYTEFYAEDGVIKGGGYTGAWRVNGDQMCFKYGADPESCWAVTLEGDQVQWMKADKTDGTGTIVSGNPNKF